MRSIEVLAVTGRPDSADTDKSPTERAAWAQTSETGRGVRTIPVTLR